MADPLIILSRVKSRTGVSGRIKEIFSNGYSTEENLRFNDKNIRLELIRSLRAMREEWDAAMEAIADEGKLNALKSMKKYLTITDRIVNMIETSQKSYVGFFNGKDVDTGKLSMALSYDVDLAKDFDAFSYQVEDFIGKIDRNYFVDADKDSINIVRKAELLEQKFKGREKFFV